MKRHVASLFSVALASMVFTSSVAAEPAKTTLKDYAFDFTEIGYEIAFSGETRYLSRPMTSNDYFEVSADGYSLKARADRLSRKGRKMFAEYFNANCKLSFGSDDKCVVMLSGEVELDDKFQMLIWANKVDFIDPKTGSVITAFE